MRSVRAAIAAIGLGLALIAPAGAQTYPDKPIRLIGHHQEHAMKSIG